jgi:hypothetical protein
MNTEEKFVHPDLQSLKTETSPNTLRARILSKLNANEEKTTMRTRNKVARWSFSAVAAVTIVAATMMLSNTASAVDRVHAAFQDANRYHITSYMISQGKRTKTTETWVDGEERRMTIFGPDGKEIDLGNLELKVDLSHKIDVLPAKVAADGDVLMELVFDKVEAKGNSKSPEKIPLPKKIGEVSDVFIVGDQGHWQGISGGMIELDGSMTFSGADGVWIGAPTMICGENGVQYIRKLLSDKSLWNIERGVVVNNRRLDKYSLKDGFAHLELFVDPATELPYLSRTRFGEGKDELIIEDVYDYVTPMPVASKAPAKSLIKTPAPAKAPVKVKTVQ